MLSVELSDNLHNSLSKEHLRDIEGVFQATRGLRVLFVGVKSLLIKLYQKKIAPSKIAGFTLNLAVYTPVQG